MASLTDKLTDDQTLLLRAIYSHYAKKLSWPNWQWVKRWFRQHSDTDPKVVRDSFPTVGTPGPPGPSYGLIQYNPYDHSDNNELKLYIAAGLHLPEFTRLATKLVEIIQFFAEGVKYLDPDDEPVKFTAERLARAKTWDPNLLPRLPDLLNHEPFGLFSSSNVKPDGTSWEVTLSEEGLIPYADVSTVEEYIAKVAERIIAETGANENATVGKAEETRSRVVIAPYVNESLIDELEELGSTSWQLGKLVSMLRELNANYAAEHTYSCLMLCRAIIDHVPPLFGRASFTDVVSQVKGTTDKNYLRLLKESRFIGDDVLHRRIGKKPDLVEFHDVPPRLGINTLIRLVITELS